MVAPAGAPRQAMGRRDGRPFLAGRTVSSVRLLCLVQKAAAIGEGMGAAVRLPQCRFLGKREFN